MTKKKIRAKYIRFSEETNALDYLIKACSYIEIVERNPQDWKWVIISLHGSLYGFSICAVQGTNSQTVTYLNKKGKRQLISFPTALAWCQDKDKMTWNTMSKVLVLTDDQKDSIKRLTNHFRNHFEHYQPSSWSIEIHGFPKISTDVLDVIRFLALDTGNIFHLNAAQKRKVKSLIYKARNTLKKSLLYKESKIAQEQYKEKQEILSKKHV